MDRRISKHISYIEATHSNTATRKGITNAPSELQIENMKRIAEEIFEPVREHFNEPIYINSFFRSVTLNHAIGGSGTSEHCFGAAMDIRFGYNSERCNSELFNYIKENFQFSQLIWEFGNDTAPKWVHVSLLKENNRNQILKAKRIDGIVRHFSFI